MELRKHLENDVVLAKLAAPVERQVRPEAVGVREQRALGSSRGAGRVDEQQPGIGVRLGRCVGRRATAEIVEARPRQLGDPDAT